MLARQLQKRVPVTDFTANATDLFAVTLVARSAIAAAVRMTRDLPASVPPLRREYVAIYCNLHFE